jgi:hypothetical protein
MDPLLEELKARGLLDAAMADWARAHQAEHEMTLDSALLDLDLVDEEGLLLALESCSGLPAAGFADLLRLDPEVGMCLPRGFSRSFEMCPLRLSGNELVALVEDPLPEESVQELRDLFGLEVTQLVSTAHYLALARERVFDSPIDERTQKLEARLARRRRATDVRVVLENVAGADTLASAIAEALDFAGSLLDFSCFLVRRDDGLRVAAVRGGGHGTGMVLAPPEPGSSLEAAIQHGGYFLGPLSGSEEDQRFCQSLGRSSPRRVFVAPVPVVEGRPVVFYADNGPRGIAARWVAELTVLMARLGQRAGDWEEQSRSTAAAVDIPLVPRPFPQITAEDEADEEQEVEEPEEAEAEDAEPEAGEPEAPEPAASEQAQPEEPGLTAAERAVLDRLREAATEAGVSLDAFVDDRLGERPAPPAEETTAALVGEVRGLFEKLATDIPTQLARGMETAFRDMVPRLSTGAPAGAPQQRPSAAASVDLVQKEAGPREVASYRSRRRKTKRKKL